MNGSRFAPKDHSLSLPAWGPYSKRYVGISHVADRGRGLRFDLSVFPGLYRRRIDVPSATWESGWHPWTCAPDLSHFSFRHELEWKDRLYADITYLRDERENGAWVRCEFVNAKDEPETVVLHSMASLQLPTAPDRSPLRLIALEPPLEPREGVLIHPLDYATIHFARPKPKDGITTDGLYHGEVRANHSLDGSVLGGRFGEDAGDVVTYQFSLPHALSRARVQVRARGRGKLKLGGLVQAAWTFNDSAFRDYVFEGSAIAAGVHSIELITESACPGLEISALVVSDADRNHSLRFVERPTVSMPAIEVIASPSEPATGVGVVLSYPEVDQSYGLAWAAPEFEIREILNDELDRFLRHMAHNHVDRVLRGNEQGHFTNVFLRPITLAPHSRRVIWGRVCSGEQETVRAALKAFLSEAISAEGAREQFHIEQKKRISLRQVNPTGGSFALSQQLMAATTLSNVVFPIYTQRQYVLHRPPGRWWDSLYTWDSGFIGLGLIELDPDQAWENLAQYLTEPGNPHAAYIQHGSLVPMQLLLYHELINRTSRLDLAEKYYDAVRQYYRFFTGKTAGSSLASLQSNLLRSWDYFYNSGGWDDYPPQKHVHEHRLTGNVTPVITTAMAIRSAKSLQLVARHLGRTNDSAGYQADIERFSAALEAHSWDEASGVYSYVVHDDAGQPTGMLKHASGENFNRGLDGLFPLNAGIGSLERKTRLLDALFDPERFWTPVGLTAVDQTAPYYRKDGYWSGTVWFPHQWFFWKTMLDLGRPALAYAIVTRALETWRKEADESYHCFEHFLLENGRGCGWHQFSGLSTPVMIFFAACYRPGSLTVGFDALVLKTTFDADATHCDAEIRFSSSPAEVNRSVLICLRAGVAYTACCDGVELTPMELCPGLLALTIPDAGENCRRVHIAPRNQQ